MTAANCHAYPSERDILTIRDISKDTCLQNLFRKNCSIDKNVLNNFFFTTWMRIWRKKEWIQNQVPNILRKNRSHLVYCWPFLNNWRHFLLKKWPIWLQFSPPLHFSPPSTLTRDNLPSTTRKVPEITLDKARFWSRTNGPEFRSVRTVVGWDSTSYITVSGFRPWHTHDKGCVCSQKNFDSTCKPLT